MLVPIIGSVILAGVTYVALRFSPRKTREQKVRKLLQRLAELQGSANETQAADAIRRAEMIVELCELAHNNRRDLEYTLGLIRGNVEKMKSAFQEAKATGRYERRERAFTSVISIYTELQSDAYYFCSIAFPGMTALIEEAL